MRGAPRPRCWTFWATSVHGACGTTGWPVPIEEDLSRGTSRETRRPKGLAERRSISSAAAEISGSGLCSCELAVKTPDMVSQKGKRTREAFEAGCEGSG